MKPPTDSPPTPAPGRPPVREVPVLGMHCAGCVATVEKLAQAVPGVREASVNFGTQRLRMAGSASYADVSEALSAGGYDLGTRCTELHGVAAEQADRVRALLGVRRVDVRPDGLRVEHVDAADVLDGLRALLGEGGSLETEADPEGARLRKAERGWRRRVLLGAPATVFLFAAHFSLFDGLGGALAVVVTLVAAFVQFGIGRPFLAGALRALSTRRADMNVLVALGTLTAFFYSVWLTWGPTRHPVAHAHFEMCALIILLVTVGRWLEARARRTTGSAVATLARLEPETALLVRADGGTTEVPLAQVLVGDRLRVRPGGRVPTDGRVVSGSSAVDESMLTGESMPVSRVEGDPLTGGTTNTSGALEMEVTAVGSETTLRRIVDWVARAQGEKAPVARVADRVAAVFVPVVLLVALGTLVAWSLWADDGFDQGLTSAIAVLLIACPCALGLATPTAIVVGTGRAAARGILIKGGEVLEAAARIECVVFDKTGTLTFGRPEVVGIETLDVDPERVLARVGALEQHSEHPLAAALVRAAEERGCEGPPARGFQATAGQGATGFVGAVEVHVGTRAFLVASGIDPSPLDAALAAADRQGATAVLVALQRTPRAMIALRDAPRPEAAAAVGRLVAQGYEVRILSGDREAVVQALATELGAQEAWAETGPLEKARVVAGLTRVAMVGDGINDAPALAAADVGIAMGGATDVATATAGIALVRPDLERVPEALAIARATLRTIHQNLFWAFAYNVVGIPLAALGWLHPLFAAAAMALSSVSVLTNSLRLRSAKLPGSGHTA